MDVMTGTDRPDVAANDLDATRDVMTEPITTTSADISEELHAESQPQHITPGVTNDLDAESEHQLHEPPVTTPDITTDLDAESKLHEPPATHEMELEPTPQTHDISDVDASDNIMNAGLEQYSDLGVGAELRLTAEELARPLTGRRSGILETNYFFGN